MVVDAFKSLALFRVGDIRDYGGNMNILAGILLGVNATKKLMTQHTLRSDFGFVQGEYCLQGKYSLERMLSGSARSVPNYIVIIQFL